MLLLLLLRETTAEIPTVSQMSHWNILTLILSVEQTSFAIDSVKDTQTTVQAMQAASKQLKVEHKKINISEIEDMHDDLAGVCLSVAFFAPI